MMNRIKNTWVGKTHDKKKRNGFTLLEMLIVVSIILILSSMAVPRFTSASKQAKIAKIQADLHVISNAAALYEIDNGKYPATVAELATKTKDKQYLQAEPKLPDDSAYTIDAEGVVSGTYDGVTYDSASHKTEATE